MWHAVEPVTPLVDGWVLAAVCEHLEAVVDGRELRLLINVIPGSMKSLSTNVFMPAWVWGPKKRPSARFITASYSSSLTERDNVRCAQLIHSPRYRQFWGDRFDAGYSRVKLENNKTGWKLATSVEGVGTGERGDFVLIDDPNSVKQVESDQVRKSTNQWWTEVVPTRLNDVRTSAIVVIQQRTHEEDVSGVTLEKEMGFTHLMIPMRYDATRPCATSIGWTDPRTEDGELCWPERFPEREVARLERIMGPFAVASQFQQLPTSRGGGIIKRDWIGLWNMPKYPAFEYLVASLDTAMTEKQENDYSAMVILGLFRPPAERRTIAPIDRLGAVYPAEMSPRVMIVYAWQERLEFPDLVAKVAETCARYAVDTLVIESKAAGMSVGQELRRAFRNRTYGLEFYDPTGNGDKMARLYAVQWMFADGMIMAPDKAWADMVLTQLATFPRAAHDDLVDAMSQGLQHLRRRGLALLRGEHDEEREQELRMPEKVTALYPV